MKLTPAHIEALNGFGDLHHTRQFIKRLRAEFPELSRTQADGLVVQWMDEMQRRQQQRP